MLLNSQCPLATTCFGYCRVLLILYLLCERIRKYDDFRGPLRNRRTVLEMNSFIFILITNNKLHKTDIQLKDNKFRDQKAGDYFRQRSYLV